MKLYRNLFFCLVALVSTGNASTVHVTKGHSGNWQFFVDDKPFYVKGIAIGVMPGDADEAWLRMAHEAGANAVRAYAIVPREFFDHAERYGMKVNAGIWFNAIRLGTHESYRDSQFCEVLEKQALDYVRDMKDHPALLSWTLGNEVFAFTEKEEEKKAFGEFLRKLVAAVHELDPNHPIIYASSFTRDLPFVMQDVPDVDILGVNATGGVGAALSWAARHSVDKPMIVTEFAPFGAWEQRRDLNNQPYDPLDQMKAENFISSWRQITTSSGCLGGFAFSLGMLRNQDSLTWLNMNYGEDYRQSFWTLRELYTGQKPPHHVPQIVQFHVTPGKIASDGIVKVETILGTNASEVRYDYFVTPIVSDPLIVVKPVYLPTRIEVKAPGVAELRVPKTPGVYRVYVRVTDAYHDTAVANRSIDVTP